MSSTVGQARPVKPDFYVTGGTLRQDAPSYVERQADRDLFEGLMRGEFCYVLTSRQMGKSSLMVHTAARLRDAGTQVVVLDLTAFGQNLTAEQWYGGLLRRVGLQLDPDGGLEEELDDLWFAQEERVGPLERWMTALQRVVLSRISGRVVLFIDEIDAVRSLPFSTDEFFAAIRECYNRRSQDPAFERLTFCLLGVASPSDLIRDTRTTPFNIGRRIELTDFTEMEAAPLAGGLSPTSPPAPPLQGEGSLAPPSLGGKGAGGLGPAATLLLRRILFWTGGHPYLTQRLCQSVAAETAGNPKSKRPEGTRNPKLEVDHHCEALFLSPSAREKDDNLLFVRERLLQSEADRASLLDLYARVGAGKRVGVDDTNPLIDLLRLAGVARIAAGQLRVRNRIYARVFDRAWVTQHMPDAELRRQRAAYRRGLLRAGLISAAIVAVMAALAIAAVRSSSRAIRLAAARQQALTASRHLLYASQMKLAQQALEEGDLQPARELLNAWRPRPGEEELRGFEWRYFWRLCQSDAVSTSPNHASRLGFTALSPDGKLLASSDEDRTVVKLWELSTQRPIATLSVRPHLFGGEFSPDDRMLATGTREGPIQLWDLARRRPVALFKGHVGWVFGLTFSPDGRLLASGGSDRTIRLWDVVRRRPAGVLRGHTNEVRSLAFSPDGKTLASGSTDNTARLWDVPARRALGTLRGHADWIRGLTFSPDGKTLATASDDTTIKLWDRASRREIATLAGHKGQVWRVAFSPDGRTLASGSTDHTIKLWDLATKQDRSTLKGHTDIVGRLVFSPDSRTLLSDSWDGSVKRWDTTLRRDAPFLRQKVNIDAVAFSPDSRTLAVGGSSQVGGHDAWPVQLWDIASHRRIANLRGHSAMVDTLRFSPDGRLLASAGEDRTIRLWEVSRGRSVAVLRGHTDGVRCLAFSPDGKTLASGSTDKTARLWGVASRRLDATLKVDREIWHLAFSPDGKMLASGGDPLKLWDFPSRREIRLDGPAARGLPLFSPDSRTLLASSGPAGSSGPVALLRWDLATKRVQSSIRQLRGIPWWAAPSPDGKLVASHRENTISLWSLALQQEVAVLKGHTGTVYDVAFSPDGNLLASAASDGTVRLWRAASFAEIDDRAAGAAPGGSRRRERPEERP